MFRRRGKRLVRLHLKGDPRSVEGVLFHADRQHYYLQGAQLVESRVADRNVALDGVTWWKREDVFHVQELEPR